MEEKDPVAMVDEQDSVLHYHQSHTIAETARYFNLSERRIRVIVKAAKQEHPRGWCTRIADPVLVDSVVARWKSGDTKEGIALALGLNKNTVRKILKRIVPESYVGKASGERHWSWKGGRIINDNGYALVIIPRSHPFYEAMRYKGKGPAYVLEHRLVMAEHLGRPLFPHEAVHHINATRVDNRIENLQLRVSPHGNGIILRCRQCLSHDLEALPISDGEAAIFADDVKG